MLLAEVKVPVEAHGFTVLQEKRLRIDIQELSDITSCRLHLKQRLINQLARNKMLLIWLPRFVTSDEKFKLSGF